MTNHQETHSDLCTLDRIDLLKNALYQNDITTSSWVKINRVDAGAGSTNLQFKIEGTAHYLDLQSSVLELDLKITKKNGDQLDADTEVALVNLPGSSIFTRQIVSIKDNVILSQQNYDLASFFETECTYNESSKNNWLDAMATYHRDTPGHHDTLGDANIGYTKRKKLFSDSKTVTILSPIFDLLFMQNNFFLNNLSLNLELGLEKPEKCIMAAVNTDVKLNIIKAVLHVKKITVSLEKDLNIQSTLMKQNAVYPITRTGLFTKTIARGYKTAHLQNFNMEQELPTKIMVVLTDETANTGTSNQNPFNFKHFNLNSFNILVNSRSIFGEAIKCDFANDHYLEIYWQTMKSLSHIHGDGCGIDIGDYKKGSAICGGDLTASQ